ERERLAARGAGRDDEVLAAARRLPRVGLVLVELCDAVRLERAAHLRVEPVRKGRRPRRTRRLLGDVRDLRRLEQVVPDRDSDGHAARVARPAWNLVAPAGV